MFWTDVEQANFRLRDSVVCYNGKPVYVLLCAEDEETGEPYAEVLVSSSKRKKIPLNDPAWNDFRDLPAIGLINTISSKKEPRLYLLVRFPRRGNRHGLSDGCVSISYWNKERKEWTASRHNLRGFFMSCWSAWSLACAEKGGFPSFRTLVNRPEVLGLDIALAVAPNIWIRKTSEKVIEINYRTLLIGAVYLQETTYISPIYSFYKETLEDLSFPNVYVPS